MRDREKRFLQESGSLTLELITMWITWQELLGFVLDK
jgi:hypothetical protein